MKGLDFVVGLLLVALLVAAIGFGWYVGAKGARQLAGA